MSYIDLDQSEVIKQAEIGLIRAIRYMPQFLGITEKRNYQHDKERMSFPEFVLQQSEAIGAEIAVAKHFGTPIENLANTNYKTLADVGANIEVKWTRWNLGHLIVSDLDRPEDIAVLVVGKSPNYRIAGWIPVAVAKKPRYRQDRTKSWWITQDSLQPIENLLESPYGKTSI